MTSQHFKNSAKTLAQALDTAGVTLDVYAILHLTEALINKGATFVAPVEPDYRHEVLVSMAMKSAICLDMVQQNRNIMAIKELRTLAKDAGLFPDSLAGTLKPCKDAIQDSRVQAAGALYSNPWANDHDPEEPPF